MLNLLTKPNWFGIVVLEMEGDLKMFNGATLQQLRKKKKLSYTDLMFNLDKIGLRVSHPTLINWENNNTTPKSNDLRKLAEYFEVDMEYFFK